MLHIGFQGQLTLITREEREMTMEKNRTLQDIWSNVYVARMKLRAKMKEKE